MMSQGQDEGSPKTTTIDASLERYKIESFKNTNAKRVPYEEIDYNIYKSSHVVFSTTEIRLPIWIKALFARYCENGGINNTEINTRWLETENENNPSKCDEISLSFHANENENVLTITVNVTTGRIKAQGRLYKEWGAKEFARLLDLVNSPQDTWKVNNIKPFMESILKKEKIYPETSYTTEKSKQASSEENTTPITPRERSFTQMKTQLANIEAEFVLHKENTEQTIFKLSQSIEMKEKEIVTLKNSDKEKQQNISDLTLKLLQMEENINALNKRCKKIEDKNSNLQQSVHKIQNESCEEKHTWASISTPPSNMTEEYSIPTSNTFDLLADDVSNQDDDTSKFSEKTIKENKKGNSQNGKDRNQQNDTIQQDPPHTTQQNDTTQQDPSHTTQPKHSAHPDINNDHQKPINAETIIICDSNGRNLKPKELCPDSTTKYIRSPTLSQARQKIETLNFNNPKNFIIHCGTNDIEQPGNDTITETLETVELIKQKHPNCRILVSSLLPRKDELNNKIPAINEELNTQVSTKTNTTYIQHTNISNADLYDRKHLNERGVKKFAKNIKAAYFNTTPKKKEINKKYTPRDNYNQTFPQRTGMYYQNQPFQFGHNNLPNLPFTPFMNLPPPPPPPSINTLHLNKGIVPPPSSSRQDDRTNPLPPQLVGLIRQLYGCINI